MVKLNQNMVISMGQSTILHLYNRKYQNCFSNDNWNTSDSPVYCIKISPFFGTIESQEKILV